MDAERNVQLPVQTQISLKKKAKTADGAKKTKYKRSFKVTWGGRPYKSKKLDSFMKVMPNVTMIDGVCVLNNEDKGTKKTGSKKSLLKGKGPQGGPTKKSCIAEIDANNGALEPPLVVENVVLLPEKHDPSHMHLSNVDFEEPHLKLKDAKVMFSPLDSPFNTHFDFSNAELDQKSVSCGSFGGFLPGLESIADSANFLNAKDSANTDIETILYENSKHAEDDEENNNLISLDESVAHAKKQIMPYTTLNLITPSLTTSFDFIHFFIQHSGTMFTPVSGAGHLYRNSNPFLTILPSIAFRDNLTFTIMEEFAKLVIATTTLRNNRLISANTSSTSSNDSFCFSDVNSNSSLIQDMNIEEYMSLDCLENNEWDFIDERVVLRNFRENYKSFEIKSLKQAAQILADHQLKKATFDYKRVNNGIANLLLLLVYNSYFGKHNKNVNLILGTCRELLSIFNKNMADSKIKIASEHSYIVSAEQDLETFFTKNAVASSNDHTIERETQFLANWTNYNDLLTSLTFIPKHKVSSSKITDVPICNYSYLVEEPTNRMNDFKDIEYFSGVDLQVMKYMNELTRLLSIKTEFAEGSSSMAFIIQCEQLSDKLELYLAQSERERDFMIYESTNNNNWSRTENEIKEYQQLRTVNKVFALISILQVQRRLLGKLTYDEKVKSILFELIIILDEKVSRSSAQAQCLFGSIFIIGCELGNLSNDDFNQKNWSAILNKGKTIVVSHFDALMNRGVMAAQRAKEILQHIWMTNSLNTTYKDWWIILDENKINIHLSL